MTETNFVKTIIKEDDNQFDLPPSIEATFINLGSARVDIEEIPLEQDETTRVGAVGCVLTSATFRINFAESSDQSERKLLLIYNAPQC